MRDSNWLRTIIQVAPPPMETRAVYVNEGGDFETYPAAGIALHRTDEGETELTMFLFSFDGYAYDPVEDVNFIGWFAAGQHPDTGMVADAMQRLNNKLKNKPQPPARLS